MSKEKNIHIRNCTAESLIFSRQAGENSIEVRVEDETVWLPQKLIAALFDVDIRTINEHLGNIYHFGELHREATVRKFRIVQTEGRTGCLKRTLINRSSGCWKIEKNLEKKSHARMY